MMTTMETALPTRDRLVAAALAELDDKGYSAIRVDDIARRAGLTTGAIYASFPSKHGLLLAALRSRHRGAVDVALRSGHAGPDALLDAALATLDAKGYRSARVADVARRAGVPTAEVTASYPTKHHLMVAAMITRDLDQFREAAEREGQPTSPAGDGSSTTDRLLAATLAVLDEHGYRGAKLAEIARRARLTTGAIYAHYGSKEALLNAALQRRYEALFRSALDEVGETHAPGRLLGAVAATLTREAAVEHRAIMEVLAAASRDEPVRPAVGAQLARRHRALASLIEGAKATGLVSADVPSDGLAYVVQLLALGNVVGQAIGLEAPDPAEVTEALDRLGEGLGARGRTP